MSTRPSLGGLRWPVVLVMLLLLLVSGAWLALRAHMQALRQQQEQTRHQLQALVQQAAQVSQARQWHDDYRSRRAAWRRTGFTQIANPAGLGAHLHYLQQSAHLPHLAYVLQATQSCQAALWPATIPPCPEPGAAIRQSPASESPLQVTGMQLTLSLGHEAELLDWLQAVQQTYTGMFLVRECEWLLSDHFKQLKAHCLLHWFNFPAQLSNLPESGV